ncbi:hypothetical protein KAR91_62635 [Candidatus Pacearchaeota archaeon]|nr:hypothetical protein [Candidatus Pacearchaeota archaeon]
MSKKRKRTASETGKMSRRKGKAFECFCARYFTAWTGLDWQTTRNSGRTDILGDIYCVARPDMNMVIECKHRKAYSVHAMLKPTKAFEDMIEESRTKLSGDQYLVFIVKNETGIWMSETLVGKRDLTYTTWFGSRYGSPLIQTDGISWHKIQDFESINTIIEGVHFGTNPAF